MLTRLKIENYALIKTLDISPSSGLNIITGETGAGKSIMLGAVGLLLGRRTDTKVLSDLGKKCVIEGDFDISSYGLTTFFEDEDLDYEDNPIIRREITPAGKSRAFVNDTPVTLDVLRRLGTHLMDVHSQTDTLTMGDHSFQLSFIDNFAGNTHLLNTCQKQFKAYKEQQDRIVALERKITTLQNEHDYDEYLLNELSESGLQSEEQESLEQELSVLDNAGQIKNALHGARTLLSTGEHTVENTLQEIKSTLHKIGTLSSRYQEIYHRIESTCIELKDISDEIEIASDGVVYDRERINFVRERLTLIYQLQQKHQVTTISQLLEIEQNLSDKVVKTSVFEGELSELRTSAKSLEVEFSGTVSELTDHRQRVFEPLKKELEDLLADVGMPDALIEIENQKIEPSPSGMDKISLCFSASKGIAPVAISQVASGGELSRLMFCVKYILADKTALPTIIFDEIDTGVSGEVAMKMGRMMSAMAESHQVITITHLPQIAAVARSHYFVYKDEDSGRAVSKIKPLDRRERLREIAMMIGGDQPSNAAYSSAKELIKTYQN